MSKSEHRCSVCSRQVYHGSAGCIRLPEDVKLVCLDCMSNTRDRQRCHICHSTHFWQSPGEQWLCARCYPPVGDIEVVNRAEVQESAKIGVL